MKTALCTISFRHQLVSFRELAELAARLGYDGIELWGAHAAQLHELNRRQAEEDLARLRAHGLGISMVSHYVDISPEADFAASCDSCQRLIERALWCGAPRLRIFAGSRGSAELDGGERRVVIEQACELGALCREAGVQLLLETHPATLLDTPAMAAEMMRLADALRPGAALLNFDALHLWEAGGEPSACWRALKPWIGYVHLKNIDRLEHVGVFRPDIVYAAGGSREGMVALGDGAIDYEPLLELAAGEPELYGSVEWFGGDPAGMLARESVWLRGRIARAQATAAGALR
ncbi:sugar phosphate isomerase/epimerase family protein [Paenibacillus pasadenensis]|uniref:sugar phosphate isomerase/epimerase family protein n=1 Tax=Paenibacillus pasadenensis TaxID=217090 RepID=UPI000423BF0A|nr:sugar phosphate isomerase/epimerase family protein [Paenibacillus pasadenensis]